MTARLQVYKCGVCGNIVTVLHPGGGELVCCNQPMNLMEPGAVDAAQEKHVPVIEKTATGFKVTVGSVAHPMEEKHYIEWIHLVADGRGCMVFLNPDDPPMAEFALQADQVNAYAYCNLHGYWKSQS